MERFSKALKQKYEMEDLLSEYEDTTFYPLLVSLPNELAKRHLEIIQKKEFSESEAHEYLSHILEQREVTKIESRISDTEIAKLCKDPSHEIYEHIESDVFNSPDIGSGQTARVKRFDLETKDRKISMAIKYLLTPTAKTLSASSEHDMVEEVERIQTIENIEKEVSLRHFKVPHPYFHHKNEKLQCYGMELVDGANLQDVLDGSISLELHTRLKTILSRFSESKVLEESEIFLTRMHAYCIHGDIKPRNFMIDRNGMIYLIDFGQSVLATDITEKAMVQFSNLKEDEIKNTKTLLRMVFRKMTDRT